MSNIDNGKLLEEILKYLDISPSKYRDAVNSYNSVAEYLNSNGAESDIYPQGSFRLGTVIRPYIMGKDADYDIDLVCQLYFDKNKTSPGVIKKLVGDILKNSSRYNKMLDDEGKRCWTLNYANNDGIGFHMDILPAVKEDDKTILSISSLYGNEFGLASNAIAITDKVDQGYEWSSSNPRGYADWFDNINQPFYKRIKDSSKTQLFENNRDIYATIDEVPPQLIRTSLQRTIQILKRHRDVRFSGTEREDDKPISMIITTLTSVIVEAYRFQTLDALQLLKFVSQKMCEHAYLLIQKPQSNQTSSIIKRDNEGIWNIPNPANPKENFADKWHEDNNRKAIAFFDWVSMVEKDLIIPFSKDISDPSMLKKGLGDVIIDRAFESYTAKNSKAYAPPIIAINQPGKAWSV